MNTILISYDLMGWEASSAYVNLIKEIKSHWTWCHPLESFRIIKTSYSVLQIRDSLRSLVDSNDKLICIDISKRLPYSHSLNPKVFAWLLDNV